MTRVEDEWERELESDTDLDLLFVEYDTHNITVDQLQAVIHKYGFKAEVKK